MKDLFHEELREIEDAEERESTSIIGPKIPADM